jgi:uncharacterized membrane protein
MITDSKLRLISYIAAGLGAADALYLAYVKLTHQQAFCGGSGDCETVATSPYAEIAGIPIAILGLGAYLAILAVLYLETRSDFWKENGPLALFGMTLIGVIYSAYLTYLEIWVIHAICPYCVVSAVLMLILFIVAVIRLVQGQPEAKYVHKGG